MPDTLYNKSIHATGCFSSMSFTASVLGEEAITIDGSDNVIWAANVENAYVESHQTSTFESQCTILSSESNCANKKPFTRKVKAKVKAVKARLKLLTL